MENENYSYALVEKLSFPRPGGSEEELLAANLLLDEIHRFGGTGSLTAFPIPSFHLDRCAMRVTAPFTREIPVIPYGRSASLPEGGRTFGLWYAPRAAEEDFSGKSDFSDTAVLVDKLDIEGYQRLCRHHVGAVLVIMGKYFEDLTQCSAFSRVLSDSFLQLGRLPVFVIAAPDAIELLQEEAQNVLLEMRQTDTERTSHNVTAVIPGTELPEESIVLTAHYDSTPVGTGSWDNATGAATLMVLYRHFLQNPPRRTLRFIWCGSEEMGLLGSRAYVEQNAELIPEIRFCFNFDMCGTVLGPNLIFVTGSEELEAFVRQFCRHEGYSAEIWKRVQSSDSAPFADKGIPCLGLSRGTSIVTTHTRYDLIAPIGAKQLRINGDFAVRMVSHVAESTLLPVPLGMPEDVQRELDKCFHRNICK